jgi:hypothetical protein
MATAQIAAAYTTNLTLRANRHQREARGCDHSTEVI